MNLDEIKMSLQSEVSTQISDYKNTKLASVLVILFGSPPKILMTKKSSILKIHAGEISLPGGKFDTGDIDLLDTAVRETREEVNLSIRRDQIIGKLSTVRTLNSGFSIIPFVAVVNRLPRLKDNLEVETILHIPFYQLLKTMANDPDPSHNIIKEMYTFSFKGHIIWGASARILKEIHDILSKDKLI